MYDYVYCRLRVNIYIHSTSLLSLAHVVFLQVSPCNFYFDKINVSTIQSMFAFDSALSDPAIRPPLLLLISNFTKLIDDPEASPLENPSTHPISQRACFFSLWKICSQFFGTTSGLLLFCLTNFDEYLWGFGLRRLFDLIFRAGRPLVDDG